MILLFLAMLAQDAPNANPGSGLVDTVAPYLGCLSTPSVADCSSVREKTAEDLDRLFVKQGGLSERERHDQAESVLAALDRSVAQIRAAGAPPAGSVVTDTVSTSHSFPWALRVQVGHYSACVNDNFNRLLRSTPQLRQSAQVRALFVDAKGQCVEVRATATGEADVILRDTEHSDEKRAKIIADALDTVDGQGESFATTFDHAAAAAGKQE